MKNLLLSALICGFLGAGGPEWEDSLPSLVGASCLEEISSEDVEHFRNLAGNPLDINHCGPGKLKSSMLFSQYQIASLTDYIRSTGELRSLTELSLVNGFSVEFVRLIVPFLEIRTTLMPGERNVRSIKEDLSVRSDLKSISAKCSIKSGNLVTLSAGYVSGGAPTFCISANKGRWSAAAGDFNIRFGQGLTMWSGMTMSGAAGGSAEKNPGGICPSSSYSRGSRMRGASLSYDSMHYYATICADIDRNLGFNTGYVWNTGQVGVTSLLNGSDCFIGADVKQKAGKADLFAEASLSPSLKSAACLIGIQWQPEYQKTGYLLARYYPYSYDNPFSGAFRTFSKCNDELGITAGSSSKTLTLTLDAVCRPEKKVQSYKSVIVYKPDIKTNKLSIIPQFRATARYRPQDKFPFHSELRADLSLGAGRWTLSGRGQATACRGIGYLGYLQGEYEGKIFETQARLTMYDIEYWDDRIYVWQRDLPGSFNVPAFYGRGMSASIWCSYKKALYLRASYDIFKRKDSPLTEKWGIRLEYVKHFFHPGTAGSLDKDKRVKDRIGGKERRKFIGSGEALE